jgi:sugar lactone lactonase YvrE
LVLSAGVLPLLAPSVAQAAGPDPQGTIYVADYGAAAIKIFAPGSNGNVAPERVISGANTGLDLPGDVKVDALGDIYVANLDGQNVEEFAPGATGNATPIRVISGSNTTFDFPDDFSLAPDGTLYVGNDDGGIIQVFAPGASGNATPIRTITGANTGLGSDVDGVGVDANGTLYAANTDNSKISVFAPGANGNVAPEYTISGANTGLDGPNDVVVGFDGSLYVTNHNGAFNSVEVFSPGAKGNATPAQNITPNGTNFLDDVGLDASGNIWVTDWEGEQTLEFAANATGVAAPIATLSGLNPSFDSPEGVFIAGPPASSSATVSTAVAAAQIGLTTPTSDTAIFAGGTSPKGSLVFKLFGPGDSTCSAAPAYISPPQAVNGDGNYQSPSFTPTQEGTYSWVALYSGDPNNAAVTTACNDPAETVTVGASNPNGYRLVANDGGIFDFGLNFNGSLANNHLNAPIVGIANAPGVNGYVMAGGDGGVFALGGANFFGSLGAQAIPSPIAAIAAPPTENGYWLAAQNGKVYNFGGVPALPAVELPSGAHIVGMASTTDGQGAWLTDQLGDVYAEGSARYVGGPGGKTLNAPIVGIAAAANGQGYVLVASDGGVFNYGTQQFFGSVPGSLKAGQHLVAPIVGIAVTHSGNGYWAVGNDGGVFNYGDAPFLGSTYTALHPGQPLNAPIAGIQHLGSAG